MFADSALVIDDEAPIRRVMRTALGGEVARVIEAATGAAGIELAAAERPSLVVLDLGLPDMDGIDVCRALRAFTPAPIIVLTARHADAEKVALLDAGADDYVTKPFSTAEFQARARVQLRRARAAAAGPLGEIVTVGELRIDLAKPAASRGEVAIHLTRTEWGLLRALLAHRGRTQTHRQLHHAVWGTAFGDVAQLLRVHVRSLRRKLERDPVRPALILTEPGVGYRIETGD